MADFSTFLRENPIVLAISFAASLVTLATAVAAIRRHRHSKKDSASQPAAEHQELAAIESDRSRKFRPKPVKGTGVFGILGFTREYDRKLNSIAELTASKAPHGRIEILRGDFAGENRHIARACSACLVRAMRERGFSVVSDNAEAILEVYSIGVYRDVMSHIKEKMTGERYVDEELYLEYVCRFTVSDVVGGEVLWDGQVRIPRHELGPSL